MNRVEKIHDLLANMREHQCLVSINIGYKCAGGEVLHLQGLKVVDRSRLPDQMLKFGNGALEEIDRDKEKHKGGGKNEKAGDAGNGAAPGDGVAVPGSE